MPNSNAPTVENEDQAITILENLVDTGKFDTDIEDIEQFLEAVDWVKFSVYIPSPPKDASISPPMMEAYIRLQKSIYQTVALAKYGQGNIQKLSQDDKEKYSINVEVKSGCSDQVVDLNAIITNLGKDLIGQMTPDQIFYLLTTIIVSFSASYAWKLFLQNKKETRLAEISSEERKATLNSFETINFEETTRLNSILKQSSNIVNLGQEILKRSEITNEAFLKAAMEEKDAKIQGVTIPASIAKELRTSNRRKASIYTVEKEMRVVDLNTQDEFKIIAFLEDAETLDVIKIECKDAILAANSRGALFAALDQRKAILIQMQVKDLEGDITPLDLMSATLVECTDN